MKRYAYLDCKVGKPLFALFLFAMLMLARDTLVTSCILGFNKSQFLMLGLICIVAAGFLLVHRKDWKGIVLDKRIALLLISTVILLLPMVLKRDWQMMYFSILLCLYFAVFLTYFKSSGEVAKYYVVILTVLAAYSVLATYVLKGPALDGIIQVPVFRNSTGWKFLNFGLCFAVKDSIWFRNFGIFREPGVYQFFLLMGLYLNNYAVVWEKQRNLWLINVILAVTMVTTFATGGLIEMALFAVFLYFDKKWHKTKVGRTGGIIAVAAVLLGAAALFLRMQMGNVVHTVYYEIYDMFLRLLTRSESLVDRLSSIFINIRLFFANPLAGAEIAEVLYAVDNNTSSTLILYAILGVLGGTLNVAAWVALAWKKERGIFGNLFLLMILFMSFNTQNLVADVFFWLFPYMALTERMLPWLEDRKKKV